MRAVFLYGSVSRGVDPAGSIREFDSHRCHHPAKRRNLPPLTPDGGRSPSGKAPADGIVVCYTEEGIIFRRKKE